MALSEQKLESHLACNAQHITLCFQLGPSHLDLSLERALQEALRHFKNKPPPGSPRSPTSHERRKSRSSAEVSGVHLICYRTWTLALIALFSGRIFGEGPFFLASAVPFSPQEGMFA